MQQQQSSNPNHIKLTWKVLPSTPKIYKKMSIPQSLHYSPFLDTPYQIQQDNYTQIPKCRHCGAFINRYSVLHENGTQIKCCFCQQWSTIKSHQKSVVIQMLKPDSYIYFQEDNYYRNKTRYQGYIFIIDLTIEQNELNIIKQNIIAMIKTLKECRISLITYGRNIYLYQFHTAMNTILCVSSANRIEVNSVFGCNDPGNMNDTIYAYNERVECFIKRLKNITSQRKNINGLREQRCTGSVLQVALVCAQLTPQIIPKIILFSAGVSTIGPSKVVGLNYSQELRNLNSHKINYQLKLYYSKLRKKVFFLKIVIDMFLFSFDQNGFTQLKSIAECCGGFVCTQQTFDSDVFKNTFNKLYVNQYLPQWAQQGYLATYCSKEVVINGLIGHCQPLQYISYNKYCQRMISNHQIGKGQNLQWYVGQLDKTKSYCLFFQPQISYNVNKHYYIQILVRYKLANNPYYHAYRVSTVCGRISNDILEISKGFDEEAGIITVAKITLNEIDQSSNYRIYVDSMLFKWCKMFASYEMGVISSFTLPENMRLMIQYVYHLRRNKLIRRQYCSLDQYNYYHYCLMRQRPSNVILIIEAALLKYTLQNPSQPEAIELNMKQMKADVILILDSYFHVVQWWGQNIVNWIQNNYHQQQQYSHLKELITVPISNIDLIVSDRYPHPLYQKTQQNTSQQRYLKSKLSLYGPSHENMPSEQCNLETFTRFLLQMVVKEK